MEEASATSGHEIRMIRSKGKVPRIEGEEQFGCRGSAVSLGRAFRKPSGPPGASLSASPPHSEGGIAATRYKASLDFLGSVI